MKLGNIRLTATRLALIGCLLTTPLVSAEVYRWTDENGVTHFSETPPPAGQEAEISDMPAEQEGAGIGMPVDDGLYDSDNSAEALSAADLERRQLAEQRNQRQAEQEALSAICEETRDRLAQIEPSRRVFYTDEEGETVRMDDQERVAEVDRLHNFLDNNCP